MIYIAGALCSIMKHAKSYSGVWLPDVAEIKRMRVEKGWTQAELAKKAGVSQALVAKMEQGKVEPSYSKVKSIIEVLLDVPEADKVAAADIANSPVASVKPDDSVSSAVRIMEEHGYSQLPVMDGNVVVGSIGDFCIVKKLESGALKNDVDLMVRRIMDPPFPVVDVGCSVVLVRPLVLHYPAVLVSDKGEIKGIVTKADFFKVLEL